MTYILRRIWKIVH